MAKKVIIPAKYLANTNIFSKKAVAELPKCLDINEHVIDLEPGRQPSYRLIYSLDKVEFKTFETYIKTNMTNGFICLSKSLARTLILFI